MSRITMFLYGLVCYSVALAVFVYAFGFIGGFLTPTILDGAPHQPLALALAIDLALLAAFAAQHSGMAGRPSNAGGHASCRRRPSAALTCS